MKLQFATAVAAVALFALGDGLAAAWGKSGRWWWFALMLIAGNAAWVLFAFLNQSWPLATASGVVNVGLSLAGIVVGFAVFRERLLPLEKLGLAFGIVAMALFVVARWNPEPAPAAEPTPKVEASE